MSATEALCMSLANLKLTNIDPQFSTISANRSSPVQSMDDLLDNDIPMEPVEDQASMRNSFSSIDSIPTEKRFYSKSEVKTVNRISDEEIVSDIYVIPRRSKSQPPTSSSLQRIMDLNVSNVSFLSDGFHRLWHVNPLDKNVPCIDCYYRKQQESRIDSVPCHERRSYHRMKNVLLNSEFWACIPRITNSYIHLVFNLFFVGAVCYGLCFFAFSLRSDVLAKLVVCLICCSTILLYYSLQHHSKELSYKAAECRSEYQRNKCEPSLRVPALEQACNNWSLCMESTITHGAKLSAETAGQVINSFLEQISWRSVVLLVIGIVLLFISLNILLSLARWQFEKLSSPPDTSKTVPCLTEPHCYNNAVDHDSMLCCNHKKRSSFTSLRRAPS